MIRRRANSTAWQFGDRFKGVPCQHVDAGGPICIFL